MIEGHRLVMSIVLWLFFVLTSLAEFLLGHTPLADNALGIRVVHSLIMAYLSWNVLAALYGEKDSRRENQKRLQSPIWWMMLLGLAIVLAVFFNVFDMAGRTTNFVAGFMPFAPTTPEAAQTSYKIGERLVMGLVTFAGVLLIKRSVYRKPTPKRVVERIQVAVPADPAKAGTAAGRAGRAAGSKLPRR